MAGALEAAGLPEGSLSIVHGLEAGGVGQFCTKPGIAFIPAGRDGDQLEASLAAAVRTVPGGVMLSDAIRETFAAGAGLRVGLDGVTTLAEGAHDGGHVAVAAVLPVAASRLCGGAHHELLQECFGPVTVVVRYERDDELLQVLGYLDGALTGTIHTAGGDMALVGDVARLLERKAGRLLYNGMPTGVAVSWAMHHGGPYPATTSLRTSVGTTAIRRFLRPICYQDAPKELLPAELRSDNPLRIPRRVNGRIQLPRQP